MRRKHNSLRRSGSLAVETALVLPIAFLFIFGVFEYARFMFFLEVAENAAREGARYAAVNTARNVTVGTTSSTATPTTTTVNGQTKQYFDGDATTPPTIIGVVNYFMAGRKNDVIGYGVSVYSADSSGNNVGTWNSGQWGTSICVQITGTYRFNVTQLLKLPGSVPINLKALVSSEAN